MIDTELLKKRCDLVALIGRDVQLKRVATTGGGEYAGPCPFCGGTDRLHVQAQGTWFCRQCGDGTWQDAIAYIRQREPGLSFVDACHQLEAGNLSRSIVRRTPATSAMRLPEPPAETWQEKAMDAGLACAEVLWSDDDWAQLWLAWLRARGLSDDTIRRAGLGVQYKTEWIDPKTKIEYAKVVGVTVARGITIPWMVAGNLWALKIRRASEEDKYTQVKGGQAALYLADDLVGRDLAVICEGEFDTLLLRQHAGDLAAVVTFGGATTHDVMGWLPWLVHLRRVLVATDNDGPGEAAWAFWRKTTKRAQRLLPPGGCKDITDAHLAGHNLRAWIGDALS